MLLEIMFADQLGELPDQFLSLIFLLVLHPVLQMVFPLGLQKQDVEIGPKHFFIVLGHRPVFCQHRLPQGKEFLAFSAGEIDLNEGRSRLIVKEGKLLKLMVVVAQIEEVVGKKQDVSLDFLLGFPCMNLPGIHRKQHARLGVIPLKINQLTSSSAFCEKEHVIIMPVGFGA